MNRIGLAALLLLPMLPACAQTPYDSKEKAAVSAQEIPINRGSTALWQSLKKLHTRASLIMVTAHPDDEDGGMLVYESRGQGARVTLLTLNRGEGGAMVIESPVNDTIRKLANVCADFDQSFIHLGRNDSNGRQRQIINNLLSLDIESAQNDQMRNFFPMP